MSLIPHTPKYFHLHVRDPVMKFKSDINTQMYALKNGYYTLKFSFFSAHEYKIKITVTCTNIYAQTFHKIIT